jgi:anti-anti-sigma factor
MFLTTADPTGTIIVATLDRDRLDCTAAEGFKQAFEALLPAHGGLVVDLHRMQFVDSVGLGALLFATRRAASARTPLVFCALTTMVEALITRVRMDQVIPLARDADRALRLLQPRTGG